MNVDDLRIMTTKEAAQALNRAEQTLRIWACRGTGPLRPTRIYGRLAWRWSDIRKLIEGGAPR